VTYKHEKTKNQPIMITSKKLNIRVKTIASFSSNTNHFGGTTDTTIPPTTTIQATFIFAKK
jgi:hypothetical protein